MKIKRILLPLFIISIFAGFNAVSPEITFAATTQTAKPTYRTQQIPTGIKEASVKLGLWKDIYTSNKKVVVYSYKPGSTCPYQSVEFHNKVNSAAAGSAGKYYARPTGPDKMEKEVNTVTAKLKAKADLASKNGSYAEVNREIQAFNKLLQFTNQCTLRACIINPAKNEYILMNRDSAEAVKIMRTYKD